MAKNQEVSVMKSRQGIVMNDLVNQNAEIQQLLFELQARLDDYQAKMSQIEKEKRELEKINKTENERRVE